MTTSNSYLLDVEFWLSIIMAAFFIVSHRSSLELCRSFIRPSVSFLIFNDRLKSLERSDFCRSLQLDSGSCYHAMLVYLHFWCPNNRFIILVKSTYFWCILLG